MVTIAADVGVIEERTQVAGDFRAWCESLYEQLLEEYEEQGHVPPEANAAFIRQCEEHPRCEHKIIFGVMSDVRDRWLAERRHVPECYPIKDLQAPAWEPLRKPVFLPGEHDWSRGPLEDARLQIEAVLTADASNGEIIQTVHELCSGARGESRTAWYVDACPEGNHPGFAVPPRWHKNVPKIDTIAKRLHFSKAQAQAAVKTGLWFLAAHQVAVYRFKEGVDVLVRGHEGAIQIADGTEEQTIVDAVMEIPESLCKNQPHIYNKLAHPVWFQDSDSEEFQRWHAEALVLHVEQVRERRRQQWAEDDVRQAEMDRLEAEFAATGVLPDEESDLDWNTAREQGLTYDMFRAKRGAWHQWREAKLKSLRESAEVALLSAAEELGINLDSIARSPDCGDLIAELRLLRNRPELTQADKWNEIHRLMPMSQLLTVYTVNGAEIEPGRAMEVLRRMDWSAAEVIREVPWNGDEKSARKGEFQSHTGIWQRMVLHGGAVLVRNMGDADMALVWLTRPYGVYKPYEQPKPLGPVRARKVKPADYDDVADNNDELWSVRQMAAVNFGAEYAATGGAPPRPLVNADSTDQEWAAHEGWWDFAHAHPWLVAGIYGSADRVPPRPFNPMTPAIPRRYKAMGEGALNEPPDKDEIETERKGRLNVLYARQAAVDAYNQMKEAEAAAEEARNERRQRELELEEQTRQRMAEAQEREERMGLPYDSPYSPAWELSTRTLNWHMGMRCLVDCGVPELNAVRRPEEGTEADIQYRATMREHNRKRLRNDTRELDKMVTQRRVGGQNQSGVTSWRGDLVLGGIIGTLSQLDAVSGFERYYGMNDEITLEQVKTAAAQCQQQYPATAQALLDYADLFA